MSRILIKNGYVVTVNDNRDIWPSGAVAIKDGRIETVTASSTAFEDRDFDEVIDASGCLVMPGLINAHQHHWYSLFKGMADGLLLEDWISDLVFPWSRISTMRPCGSPAINAGWKCWRPARPVPSTIR